ncbi:uncharacterized protein DFL_004385 [Arthrobotrys flagrans]|uniref:Alpha-type protein kinase domain-containing protein n=1 Tax=Arthrobotrys flagrans TaxID=97331 RepID=A0A437A4I8_ARTFL|nr:hypothetical protein DFL_004385 [Arthrobotrys flagrans]
MPLLRINSSTYKMAYVFFEAYSAVSPNSKVVTTSVSTSASLSVPTPFSVTRRPAKDFEVVSEDSPPEWGSPGWFNQALTLEAFSADGVMSMTAYARSAASRNWLVIKPFKRGGKTFIDLVDDMCSQALCKAFALEFNALVSEKYSLDFILVTCLRPKPDTRNAADFLSLELSIEGDYVRYNSNSGWVNPSISNPTSQAAQVPTDPAIHTADKARFSSMDVNLNDDGFKFFFFSHQRNRVCKNLGLKSNKAMLLTGNFEFGQI